MSDEREVGSMGTRHVELESQTISGTPPRTSGTPSEIGKLKHRRVRAMASAVGLPLTGMVIVLGAWWSATAALDIKRIILPAPPDVVDALFRLPGYLLEHARVTLVETVIGYGLTVVAGLLVGAAIAESRIIDQTASPWLVALNAVPKVALAPLLVVWLGFEGQSRVAMVMLMCFFPIVLATASGLRSTPAELVELARSLDASRVRTFLKIRFPNAVPQVMVGLKVAMPLAVVGAVIGEFRGNTGLGQVIVRASGSGDTALAFAAIVILSFISVALYYSLIAAERLLLPWVRGMTS